MESVSIYDVESSPTETGVERHRLADSLGTTDLALNHYVLEPGERFSGSLHVHMDQEEVFVVVAGEATFELLDGAITIEKGEAVRFAPGEFQSGKNEADERVVAFALGAPRDSENIRVPLRCPECGHDEMRAVVLEDKRRAVGICQNCDAELAVE